jgi:hypothetical protein
MGVEDKALQNRAEYFNIPYPYYQEYNGKIAKLT